MFASTEDKFAFDVQWRDPRTDVTWSYLLLLFPETGEVEMIDTKSRKVFLKRCLPDGPKILPELLRPGATLTLLSRQLYVLGYGDSHTKSKLQVQQERTLGIIKPDAIDRFVEIVGIVYQAGFLIGDLKMCHLRREEAQEFYAVHSRQPFFPSLVEFMTSGPILAIELLAEDAVLRWRKLIGPTDSGLARQTAPSSIRSLFGTDKTFNACHGSDAQSTAQAECAFFFGREVGECWGRNNSSLCIVKPHAFAAQSLPGILGVLTQQMQVTAAKTCHFTVPDATKFLEVYKGVVPLSEFKGMVDELCAGTSVALEASLLSDTAASPVEELRRICGPLDPTVGKALAPHTLRAQFGESKIQNAVHCTDLEEDGQREIAFAFRL